jgi:hypothetical protein
MTQIAPPIGGAFFSMQKSETNTRGVQFQHKGPGGVQKKDGGDFFSNLVRKI